MLSQAVTWALRVPEQPGRSPREVAVEFLKRHPTLLVLVLVLDNREHVFGATSTLADFLLRACRDLRILATSREPLCVGRETVWSVPPLSLPPNQRHLSPEQTAESEAVRLFLERIRRNVAACNRTQHVETAAPRIRCRAETDHRNHWERTGGRFGIACLPGTRRSPILGSMRGCRSARWILRGESTHAPWNSGRTGTSSTATSRSGPTSRRPSIPVSPPTRVASRNIPMTMQTTKKPSATAAEAHLRLSGLAGNPRRCDAGSG